MTILLDNHVRKTAGADGPTSRLLLVYRQWLAGGPGPSSRCRRQALIRARGTLRPPDGG